MIPDLGSVKDELRQSKSRFRRPRAQYPISAIIDAIETIYEEVAPARFPHGQERIDVDWDE